MIINPNNHTNNHSQQKDILKIQLRELHYQQKQIKWQRTHLNKKEIEMEKTNSLELGKTQLKEDDREQTKNLKN
jgi:hypothetical protein